NFGFLNPGDSLLVWLVPQAACSLIAIRFYVLNWEGSMLVDVWDASRYEPKISSLDSVDANGWIGTFFSYGYWVPGDVIRHSPLGWSATDPEHHHWGPFPLSVTEAHAQSWVEIPASYGLQGEVDLGSDPFYIGAVFYRTAGWGFGGEYPWTTPYNFFKFYSLCCGPDGAHDGWFIRSQCIWFEAVIRYYENTPPEIKNVTVQNDTYAPGPFPISARITDKDAENPVNAGVAKAYLVYTINDLTDSTHMNGPCTGGLFSGTLPLISKNDTIKYYISAYDPHKLHSKSKAITFARIEPKHPAADVLIVTDDVRFEDFYTYLFDHMLLDERGNQRIEYEYWNLKTHQGIDASVINWGWHTIIIAGWGCANVLPSKDYSPDDLFAFFLNSGENWENHNLLYIDQDYFCAHEEYQCDWDGELGPGDFLYDYFGVERVISNNYGSENGNYDSVAIGLRDFEDININFEPAYLTEHPERWNWPDWLIELTEDAEQILNYKDSDFGAGVRRDGGHYKTVFRPWQLDFATDISEIGGLKPHREAPSLLEKILCWFNICWNTPPTFSHLYVQNYTYDPGPFPITVTIHDGDVACYRAGIASADLVYTIGNITDSVSMVGPVSGGTFHGTIPEIAVWDTVTYYVTACDSEDLCSRSDSITFARIEPEHPEADMLVVWDYTGDPDLDTFFVDLFASLETQYEYELWNNPRQQGIDASVINWGWSAIYVSGWGCANTLPGRDYTGNSFVEWLQSGTVDEPHNLLYVDQDYFCVHPEYDCDWDLELSPGEFIYDYFG
ncbi:MAG: hypothetical protein ACE5OR_16470, partial [bacterium]